MTDEAMQGEAHGVLRLGDSLRHRGGRRPGASVFAISIAIHAAAVAAFFVAGAGDDEPVEKYQTVAMHLVSPPPAVLGPPERVETTAAVVSEPVVTETKKVETPVVKPKPQTQSALDSKVVSKPTEAKPAQGLNPKPGPVSGEGLNIIQDGVPFPYPDYLSNVIFRLTSSLRWQGAPNLTAEVGFYIRRDGTVGAIRLLKPSGNDEFDIAAVAAVENAGRARAMGPLPAQWQGDRLAINFRFVPNR